MHIDNTDLSLLMNDMHVFRDTGSRLVIPSYSTEGFLISRLNRDPKLLGSRDNLIIAPFGFGNIDVDIYPGLASNSSAKAEIVKPPFFITPEKIVSIGSLDYIIYPDFQSLDLTGSLVYDRPVYLVTFKDMFDTGAVKRV